MDFKYDRALNALGMIVVLTLLGFPLQATGQTEKFGDIKYSAPNGWTRSAKDHAIVFSEINPAEGQFGFITLYTAGVSDGSPQKDFAREWKARVVEPWGGDPNPKTVTEPDNGWTAIAGGSQIDFNGNKAFAFLTVVSGFGKSVSLLGVLNDDSYLAPLQAFAESMVIDKTPFKSTAAAAPSVAAPVLQYDDFGRLIIPLPTRQLTISDLAGQWGQSDSMNTRYVFRDTGTYAGFESLTFKSKMTLTSDGGFFDDFYAIQNGKMIKEKTAGTFAINGRVLLIRQRNAAKYVIRGWLETPEMTILEVCGPWYDDDVIPQEIFTNPVQGANLNKRWARKK